jgi:hypothetical protein
MANLKSSSSDTTNSISALNNTVLGFDLLGGTTLEQAKKAVALLNENVLNVFVTVKQNGVVSGS